MSRHASPLIGFNNNVCYRGRRFHIQTEDSGVNRPHIITHLFVDGGQIVKSIRTDYSDCVDQPDRAEVVYEMMREQHKAMALDLRDGFLDRRLEGLLDDEVESKASPSEVASLAEAAEPGGMLADDPASQQAAALEARGVDSAKAPPRSQPAHTRTAPPSAPVRSRRRSVVPKPEKSSTRYSVYPSGRPSEPPGERRAASASSSRTSQRPSLGRPEAGPRTSPSAQSIFGVAPQESLDDVILGYLASFKEGDDETSK